MIRTITSARYFGNSELVDIRIDAGGRIASVCPADRGRKNRDTQGDSIAADGRLVTAGLWDEHVHMLQWAQQHGRINASGCRSADELLHMIAAKSPHAEELIIVSVRGSLWGEALTRERLDAVTGATPTVLIGIDLHGCWLNAAALLRHGFDPNGTSHIVEEDCFRVQRDLDRMSEDELDRRVTISAAAAAARGVVGVVDFEMRWGCEDWLRRERRGFRSLRVETAIYPQFLDRAVNEGLRSGDALSASGRIRVGPLKVITDGSLGTHTAWCCEPYPNGGTGRCLVPPAELRMLLERAHRSGFTAAVHAIGDRAAQAALDAFARSGCAGRIEHAQLLRHEDIPRFAELGVAASVQAEHLLDDRAAIAALWPGRAERCFAFASLLRAGVPLRFGSDAPVAPLDPWRGIAAAVYRARAGEEPFTPAERLTVPQALQASMRGRLRPQPGDIADLILLDADPAESDATALSTLPVAATLIAGELSYHLSELR